MRSTPYQLQQKGGFLQVVLIGRENKQASPVFEGFDNVFVDSIRYRWTPKTTPQTTNFTNKIFAHVIGAVHYDRTVEGIGVKAIFKPFEFQRQAVFTLVRPQSLVKPQT